MFTWTRRRLVWIVILFTAAVLRFPGADWDAGYALHPDERYLVDLSRKITYYSNPCAIEPQFPYGHIPLYLISPSTSAGYEGDPLFSARLFSGLLGVLLVAVTGAIGRVLDKHSDRLGWGAAIIITFAPLLIQNARFYTVDSLGTVAVTISLLAALRQRWMIAAVCASISSGSKISFIWIWPVLFASVCITHQNMLNQKSAQHNLMKAIIKVVCWGAVTYILTSPWMILDFRRCWYGPLAQINIVTGSTVLPYTLQFNGTLPYLYPVKQMIIWGLGPLCTILGFGTIVIGILNWRKVDRVNQVVLLWIMCYGAVTGGQYVKFPRYLLPLYPWIANLAIKTSFSLFSSRSHRAWRRFTVFLCVVPTVLMGLAQNSVYQQEHPWVAASTWLTNNLLPGGSIAYEMWDHPLPLLNTENPYDMTALAVYEDNMQDIALSHQQTTQKVDMLVIASRRAYGALARNARHYEDTLAWYTDVLTSDQIRVFTICPKVGPVSFSDDPLLDNGLPEVLSLQERCGTPFVFRLPRLDESFRVYDTPMVILVPKAKE